MTNGKFPFPIAPIAQLAQTRVSVLPRAIVAQG